MTKDEALKMALEHFETWSHEDSIFAGEFDKEITAIKEALMSDTDGAQPEHGWTPERIAGMARLKDAQDKRLAQPSVSVEKEPVAFVKGCNKGQWEIFPAKAYQIFEREQPLYTTPPDWRQPQRKPLSNEEINEFFQGMEPNNGFWLSFARAIEAAHGIKELKEYKK